MSNGVELTNMKSGTSDGAVNPAYSEASVSDVGIEVDKYPTKPPANGVTTFGEDNNEEPNCFVSFIATIQDGLSGFYNENCRTIWALFKIALVLGYLVYFGFAMGKEKLENNASVQLLWMTLLFFFILAIYLIFKYYGDAIYKSMAPCTDQISQNSTRISWIVVALLYTFIIAFIIVDVTVISKRTENLISLIGIVAFVVILFIFSYSPSKVQWRAVFWGIALQFILALFILRWKVGFDVFNWIGERFAAFLAYTVAGSAFVFGEDTYFHHYFAFVILPTIIFFSTIISILFHLGAMQVIIKGVAIVMQAVMGTTAGESLNAAGNIFVGQTEAPLMIRPLLNDMTHSELHAVMTGGFATIAGGVLAAFISLGVPANHLISASVMSAPAALAMAKLFYPETEKSKTTSKDVRHLPKGTEQNVIEAATAGASASISLVANVGANIIAFLAILAFVNATLTWFGDRVHIEGLTFELICSYVLQPFVWTMGIPWDESPQVARLIGIKSFLNEFIAYTELGKILENTAVFEAHVAANGTWSRNRWTVCLDNCAPANYTETEMICTDSIMMNSSLVNETMTNCTEVNTTVTRLTEPCILEDGIMSPRAVAITTYALCGFANIGSIGIQLGGLGAMAPDKRPALARVAVRAMIAGSVACFLTASIAGLFYQDHDGGSSAFD